MSIKPNSKKYLLALARSAIQSTWTDTGVEFGQVPRDVRNRAGVFVTLTKGGQLRGCIGTLEPSGEVYRSVAAYAKKAAFSDPRFAPLAENERDAVRIEISVLSPMKKVTAPSPDSLAAILQSTKPGIYLRAGQFGATYLPQVWEEIPNARQFLSSLCVKAGLSDDFWVASFREVTCYAYTVESFKES